MFSTIFYERHLLGRKKAMLTFLPTCWDMKFYDSFLWVSLFFFIFSPSPALKVSPNMVTVNHLNWVNSRPCWFGHSSVPLLVIWIIAVPTEPFRTPVPAVFLPSRSPVPEKTRALLGFVGRCRCFATFLNCPCHWSFLGVLVSSLPLQAAFYRVPCSFFSLLCLPPSLVTWTCPVEHILVDWGQFSGDDWSLMIPIKVMKCPPKSQCLTF